MKPSYHGRWTRAIFFLLAFTLTATGWAQGSDPQAVALADKVIQNMGGKDAWNKARFLAWSWRNTYHVWDKYENNFRWQRDTLVVVGNLTTKQGKAYSKGKDISATPAGQKLIQNLYPTWANNSYWFIMPFKLRDDGVTLKYKGAGQTQAGEAADLIELTFKEVGVTPNNRYLLAVDKKNGLITEWSFFRNYTDEKPGFTMAWKDYRSFGGIKLSSIRGEDPKMGMSDIAVLPKVSSKLFNSPVAIQKLR